MFNQSGTVRLHRILKATPERVNRAIFFMAILSVGVIFMIQACKQVPRSDSIFNPEAFAQGWTEAWDSQNIDSILTFYTEDAFYEDVPSVENGWGPPSRGQQMIRESLSEMFEEMPDLGFKFISVFCADDHMAVEWIMTGTRYREYSGRFSIRAVSIIKLKEGKIDSVSDYYDAYLLQSQLGIIPTLEAAQPEKSE